MTRPCSYTAEPASLHHFHPAMFQRSVRCGRFTTGLIAAALVSLTVAGTPTTASAQGPQSVDLAPVADATIYSEGTANGVGFSNFIGKNAQGAFRRSLVRFDVAGAIPAGSTITTAELMFTVDNAATTTVEPHTIHRLTRAWTEGPTNSGGRGSPPVALDVTWTEASFGTSSWSSPGGDFMPAVSSSVGIGDVGAYIANGSGLAQDAQTWLDLPALAHGWIVIGNESAAAVRSAKSFGSRENTAIPVPTLRISYTTPAATVSYGTGCSAGGAPPLTLSAIGVPALGNPGFGLQIGGGSLLLASPTCLFAFSALPAPLPLLGCSFWLDPATFVTSVPTDASGILTINVPATSMMGLGFDVQGAALDLATPGVVLTNGIRLTIGV